jgi:hypothetical protein
MDCPRHKVRLTNAKRVSGLAQVVEHLPSKYKVPVPQNEGREGREGKGKKEFHSQDPSINSLCHFGNTESHPLNLQGQFPENTNHCQ